MPSAVLALLGVLSCSSLLGSQRAYKVTLLFVRAVFYMHFLARFVLYNI